MNFCCLRYSVYGVLLPELKDISKYFRLCGVFLAAYRLSLFAENRGYFPVAVHGHLIAVASLVGEHRLQGAPAR